MSVGQWLDSVITDTAMDEAVAPQQSDAAHDQVARGEAARPAQPVRRSPLDAIEPRYVGYDRDRHPMRRAPLAELGYPNHGENPPPPRRAFDLGERPNTGGPRLPAAPTADNNLAEVRARLDNLTHRIESISRDSTAADPPPPAVHQDDATRQFAAVISKLDRKLDQMIAENRSTNDEIEQRMRAVNRAAADLGAENRRPRLPAGPPATPLDQAVLEIADRQRTLDGLPHVSGAPDELAPAPLPRACTQEFAGLERQLRQINAQIDTLSRPCGIDKAVDKAVDVLRDDLAEIGVMLQEAMPRRAVEALEGEMRKLADRIDHTRQAGADSTALGGIERGLAEVRDALRALTPAESLVGLGEAVRTLSQKVDVVAGNSQDPTALKQLEGAIVAMRGIVTHVASNDALANLAEEVRTLSGKVDQATSSSGSSGLLAMIEQRIGTLADALEARNRSGQDVPHEIEAVVTRLIEKIEQIQLNTSDQTALGHLEDRIAKLVEKLDASDHRLNHLEAIERGLAELLIHLEHQRMPALARAGGEPPPEVDALLQDIVELKETERKTQDSLEAVHGTLENVVDRLATIETDMHGKIDQAVSAAVASRSPLSPSDPAPVAAMPTPDAAAIAARVTMAATGVAGPTLPAAQPKPARHSAALTAATPPVAPAPEPALVALQPAATASAPAVAAERRPIDPNLPPDHPLEPGVSRGRYPASPADRIAASEAVLGSAKPPVIPDPGGKSNFIAAARRAAQAAASDMPARTNARATEAKSARAPRSSAVVGLIRKHARAFIIGISVLAIMLGSLNIVMNWLSSSEQPQGANGQAATPTPTETEPTALKPAEPAPVPRAATEAPATPEAPAVDRQSSLPPAPSFPPPSGVLMPAPTAATTPDRDVTGSIEPQRPVPTPTPAPAPASAPTAPAVVLATPVATAHGADKVPAAITGRLRAAATKGDPAAQYEIAQRFADGRGVAQDPATAAEWFERAARQGSAPAQFRLGGLYEKGLGVQKNLDAARRFYAMAGEAGNAKALHNLAVLYAEGMDGKPDYQSAAQWFRKAAAYGMADSQYNLGILYARGIGVEQNLTEAYRWFALAAREGDKESETKRNELATRLDPQSLRNAQQAIDSFKAQPQPEAAITVKAPPGGWDSPTSGEPASSAPASSAPAGTPAAKRRSSASSRKETAPISLDLSMPRARF